MRCSQIVKDPRWALTACLLISVLNGFLGSVLTDRVADLQRCILQHSFSHNQTSRCQGKYGQFHVNRPCCSCTKLNHNQINVPILLLTIQLEYHSVHSSVCNSPISLSPGCRPISNTFFCRGQCPLSSDDGNAPLTHAYHQ